MNLEQCPECNGEKYITFPTCEGERCITCPTCEGEGEIPSEPVSHCRACGEPIELGLEWCIFHRPADLWLTKP